MVCKILIILIIKFVIFGECVSKILVGIVIVIFKIIVDKEINKCCYV